MALIIDPFFWTIFTTVYLVWVWLLPAMLIQFTFIMGFKWLLAKISPKWRKKLEITNDNSK